jgi:hypothetical protein
LHEAELALRTVTFGGVNQAQIAGQLVDVPNVSRVGFWEAAVEDATVNGISLDLAGRTAILDTGTSKLDHHSVVYV